MSAPLTLTSRPSTVPVPTARSIALCADRLRFFSEFDALERLIDSIDNKPPASPEDELNLIIRDGLIDLKLRMEPVIANLAKRAAALELLVETEAANAPGCA